MLSLLVWSEKNNTFRFLGESGFHLRIVELVRGVNLGSESTTTELKDKVVTAVKDESGNLTLILWQIDRFTGKVTRLSDTHHEPHPCIDLMQLQCQIFSMQFLE